MRSDLPVKKVSNGLIDHLRMGDGPHVTKTIELPDLNAWQGTRQEARYSQ